MPTQMHTPGPWKVRDYKTKDGGLWVDGGIARNRATGTVALVYPLSGQAANAHLIAAAPDMLAALKEISHNAAISDAWLDPVRAVIAKAEGR